MIYISKIRNRRPQESRTTYPYSIPSIINLEELNLRKEVTFIIGENGSGKSTLVEAIAINAGFNPEGGSRNFNFSTQDSHSVLYEDIQLIRTAYRNRDGFFLRAESFYNVATAVDDYLVQGAYGGSLHMRSHGESFLALLHNRLHGNGLYIFDEPESALSMISQMNMLVRIQQLVDRSSQFIIATHSPILMAYPDADIYQVSPEGIHPIAYKDTEQYRLTKYFMNNHMKMLAELGLDI
ncbi:AAA family ATPase [Sphingobacterium griseoflavum]|uniref:ABC transporter ATP-binding protein n=1 Tax=Sphingobacterium griseoflavum TaxID=1474952 RepID=A0ABQ3HV83_9SPHI|nr:AAA family ATPase [Sphingobacterium griseoflavum]GHE37115.1 ABC transporter ATP-binding protein [Sphingobacterium griseoflavum]